MRAPIHSIKHYIQTTLTTVAAGATGTVVYIPAVNSTAANSANEVTEGAIVKAVFVEVWLIGATLDQFFTAVLTKNPAGVGIPVNADLVDLFAWQNKKNILWSSQGLANNDGVSGVIPIIRTWVKIPKGKQRMGLGDSFSLAIASRGDDDLKFCGIGVYKEYR